MPSQPQRGAGTFRGLIADTVLKEALGTLLLLAVIFVGMAAVALVLATTETGEARSSDVGWAILSGAISSLFALAWWAVRRTVRRRQPTSAEQSSALG